MSIKLSIRPEQLQTLIQLASDGLISPDADFTDMFPRVKELPPSPPNCVERLPLLREWVGGIQETWIGTTAELYEELCKDDRVPGLAPLLLKHHSPLTLGWAMKYLMGEGDYGISKNRTNRGQRYTITPKKEL